MATEAGFRSCSWEAQGGSSIGFSWTRGSDRATPPFSSRPLSLTHICSLAALLFEY